jgi:hypothetical protein
LGGQVISEKHSENIKEGPMVVPKLDRQQVIGALKATGSKDRDVLYAKRSELLIESMRMKLLPIFAYVVGGTMTVTIIGAVIGIPILLFGRAVKRTINGNIEVADAALAEYLSSIGARSAAVA